MGIRVEEMYGKESSTTLRQGFDKSDNLSRAAGQSNAFEQNPCILLSCFLTPDYMRLTGWEEERSV